MSDRLTAPSYRTAHETGGDPSLRRMAIAAAAFGGVVLLGLVGMSVMRTGPRAIPVIEAPSGPVRIKPANPGGMQAAGVAFGADAGADALAPAPETPRLDAFRREFHPKAAAPVTPPPEAAPPVQASAVPPAPVAQVSPTQVSHASIQLAALESDAAAHAQWDRLRRDLPDLLGDRTPVIERAEHDGRPIWRLRVSGFADAAQATRFCEQVRAKHQACTPAYGPERQ